MALKFSNFIEANRRLAGAGRSRVLRPLVSQSVRALLEQLFKEGLTPSEGLYYCVRNPDGWFPFSYRFDEYDEHDHVQFWEQFVSPVLAFRWSRELKVPARQLEARLAPLAYALPRGRVVRNSASRYVVAHGGDMPKSISRETINRLFSLPSTVKWELDEHERCLAADRDELRRLLKLKESWPAV